MTIECFMIKATDEVARSLRRYAGGSKCPSKAKWIHDASMPLDTIQKPLQDAKPHTDGTLSGDLHPHDDPLWPHTCVCGYVFAEDDTWQLLENRMYAIAGGKQMSKRDWLKEPGAMWDAPWYPWKGPDGLSLVVVLPNGLTWNIDGPANNCTEADDYRQERHHCWTRSGTPPGITVGKADGPTCKVGAGSIKAGDYHGFLRDGRFTS